MEWLLIAIGGAIGTLSRYGLSSWAHRALGAHFPYGTLAVNLIGCLLIGFVMHIGLTSDAIPRQLRLAITVGFLGALTTFSTFSYETVHLIEDGQWSSALANIVVNLGCGALATVAGLAAGRSLIPGS